MGMVPKADDTRAMAAGTLTTVTATDTVQTGLHEVLQVILTPADDFVATALGVTVTISDQVASPGAIVIKSWMPTAGGNTAPTAATTFGKKVSWMALGK